MATFKIDDQEISFEPGETIIEAAKRAGIKIPHYCWHPGLSVAANCRMCLVEMLPPPGRKAMMLDVLRFDNATQAYVKEQKPKLVPACQQAAAPGMEIRSDSSSHVIRARAAVQEFLLLNHPVDCPICDQAGECKLQDYWLQHGSNKKRMLDEPVHKPKGVSFGPTIVYDAERCIVCTRCVRFCAEVAKDPVLTVRQRGNLNEITVAPGRQLDNGYTMMTAAVCPVGALTTKDFRFKARVWFLRSAKTVCTGCARGCNSETDFDPRTQEVYRFRPRRNAKVNGHWMCDEGVLSYRQRVERRISVAKLGSEAAPVESAIEQVKGLLTDSGGALIDGKSVAVLLGAEFSLEDNAALLWLGRALGVEAFFEAGRPDGDADQVLRLADKNGNTAGVRMLLDGEPGRLEELTDGLRAGRFTHVISLGATLKDPSQEPWFASLRKNVVVLTTHEGPLASGATVVLPVAHCTEASGTWVNAAGMSQVSEQAVKPLGDASPAYLVIRAIAQRLGLDCPYSSLAELRSRLTVGSPAVFDGRSGSDNHGVVST